MLECASQITPSLTVIFQKSIDTGTLPEDWLNANIACVYKTGDKHAAENYRSVPLTSVPCKLLEHIVYKHINSLRIRLGISSGPDAFDGFMSWSSFSTPFSLMVSFGMGSSIDKHAAVNYRSVPLTSVPCKLLEHIVYKHIM
jgi:hypothetical protein